jgi:hypothetical protein
LRRVRGLKKKKSRLCPTETKVGVATFISKRETPKPKKQPKKKKKKRKKEEGGGGRWEEEIVKPLTRKSFRKKTGFSDPATGCPQAQEEEPRSQT